MELDALDTNYTNYMHVTSWRYFLEHTVLKPYTPEALGAQTGLNWFWGSQRSQGDSRSSRWNCVNTQYSFKKHLTPDNPKDFFWYIFSLPLIWSVWSSMIFIAPNDLKVSLGIEALHTPCTWGIQGQNWFVRINMKSGDSSYMCYMVFFLGNEANSLSPVNAVDAQG